MSRKKSPAQLDAEIAGALAKRSSTKRVSRDVAAAFADMAERAEIEAGENLYLGRGALGYTGDPREFRFSALFGTSLPSAKYDRLVEIVDEYSAHPHDRLGRKLTQKEADWMRAEAKKTLEDERLYIQSVLRERNL
jgi:hypothetical protein